jgi:hypothetical protein
MLHYSLPPRALLNHRYPQNGENTYIYTPKQQQQQKQDAALKTLHLHVF